MKRFFLALALFASVGHAQNKQGIEWKPLYEPGGGGAITAVAVNPHDAQHIVSLGDMLGVATSFDGGDSWQPTFGFLTYEFSGGITFHPADKNTVWIGSASGPYRSTDRGIHWQSKRQGMPQAQGGRYTAIVETVLYDPDQPNRLLTFGGTSRRWNEADTFGWIWESLDGGENWKHIGTISKERFSNEAKKGANIISAQYAPGSKNSLHLLADGAGWFVSDDDGRTWKKQGYTGLPKAPRSLTFHPKNAGVLWATTDSYLTGQGDASREPGGVYKSSDGGKTFVPSDSGIKKVNAKSNGNLASNFPNVIVSPANPNVLYTCDGAWNASVIYKSVNGGANWLPVASREGIGVKQEAGERKVFNPKTATFAGISVTGAADPNSADKTYWFNSEFILRSRDGGKTWDDATAYQPDAKNSPDHWRGRGWVGWCSTNFAWNPYRPTQAILQCMDAGKAWVSDDNLQSWRYASVPSHPWLGGVDVSFSKDGKIFATTGQFGENNGILRSSDWGKTWTLLEGEKRGLPKGGWGGKPEYGGIFVHPENGNMVWVVSGEKILRSWDGGEAWSLVNDKIGARFFAGDPTKAGRFYVTGKEGVFVTDDGLNFVSIGGPRPGGRGRINCDAQGRVIVCQWRDGRTGVWRYTPASKEWKRLLDEPLAFECVADPSDATRLLLVTNQDPFNDLAGGNGVWISCDDGASWSQQDSGLAMRRGQAVAFNPANPEQIVVGTYGRGFFTATWPKTYKPQGTRRYAAAEEDRQSSQGNGSILANGSMSEGAEKPSGWTEIWDNVQSARDTQVFKSAPAALRVVSEGKKGMAFQQIAGQAGRSFRLTGWLKTQGKASVNVAVQSFDEKWTKNDFNQVKFLQNEFDWQPFEKIVTIPEWAARFNVAVLVEGAGTAWLDDVQMVPLGAVKTTAPQGEIKLVTPAPTTGEAPTVGQNLAKNGAMSDGAATPDGWTEKWGDVSAVRDTNIFKNGPASLRVDAKGPAGQAFQMFEGGGKTVRVSGYIKAAGAVKAQIAVQSFDAGWTKNKFDQIIFVQGENDWLPFEKEISIPDWAARFNVQLWAEGNGQAWLDEVKVLDPEATQNTTPNTTANNVVTNTDPKNSAPPKDKPSVAAWGFYPQYPQAWLAMHNGFVARTKENAAKPIGIVFLGDSITQGWGGAGKEIWQQNYAPLGAVNYGIGGDSTRQVLWRLQNGAVQGLNPKLVVLKIGTNNLYNDFNAGSDEEIADGIKAVVAELRQRLPNAKILLLGILPRQNTYFSGRIKNINAIIKKLDDGKSLRFLDMSDRFQTELGKVKPELFNGDQLHLEKPGYQLWADTMQPLFDEMLK